MVDFSAKESSVEAAIADLERLAKEKIDGQMGNLKDGEGLKSKFSNSKLTLV